MAELVDALVSGTSLRKVMGVRVPLWAKKIKFFYTAFLPSSICNILKPFYLNNKIYTAFQNTGKHIKLLMFQKQTEMQ